jgi:hypothetical protein
MVNGRFLTSSIKRGVKMLTLATILAFVLAPPAMSQGIPVINEETTDYTHLLLNISGSNFGTKVGTVTLGGSSLTVVSWSASKIVANLPATTVRMPVNS